METFKCYQIFWQRFPKYNNSLYSLFFGNDGFEKWSDFEALLLEYGLSIYNINVYLVINQYKFSIFLLEYSEKLDLKQLSDKTP